MKPDDFQFIAGFLKQRSGLDLTPDKVYLLESRLTPIARRMGLNGLDELIGHMRMRRDEDLSKKVTEAMTTNESFFFRDKTPFDLLKSDVMPRVKKANEARKTFRVWCAAASTGQEPYSIAMMFKEAEHEWRDWRIEIVGTDISHEALEKARVGIYSQFEVQRGLPIQFLIKYFRQNGEMWQIDAGIRGMVRYQEYNLLDSFAGLGRFDVIFCRNVLIYFDQPTKAAVLNRMSDIMEPHGILFLGAAETVLGITDRFKPVRGQRGLYLPADMHGRTHDMAALS